MRSRLQTPLSLMPISWGLAQFFGGLVAYGLSTREYSISPEDQFHLDRGHYHLLGYPFLSPHSRQSIEWPVGSSPQ